MKQQLQPIAWLAFAAIVAVAVVLAYFKSREVDATPGAIIEAMYPTGKDEPHASDSEIIGAIERYGDVNGVLPGGNETFLEAAVLNRQWGVIEYLLQHPDLSEESKSRVLDFAESTRMDAQAFARLRAILDRS